MFERVNELDFVLSEAIHLRWQFPNILIVQILYLAKED